MDKNGYPEEHELEEIKGWGFNQENVVERLKELWRYDDYIRYENGILELHTGGWSGNEDIIVALQGSMFWFCYWDSSHRGGHYYLKWRKKEKEKNE